MVVRRGEVEVVVVGVRRDRGVNMRSRKWPRLAVVMHVPRRKGPCRFGRVGAVAVLLGCWLKRLWCLRRVSIAGFAGLVEAMLFGAELLREVIGVVNAELGHHLLLFRRTRLAG